MKKVQHVYIKFHDETGFPDISNMEAEEFEDNGKNILAF